MKKGIMVVAILLLPSAAMLFFKTRMQPSSGPVVAEIVSPSGANSSLPNLWTDASGVSYLSWVEPREAGHALLFSRLEEGSWTPPREIVRGDNWFVNWADFPSLVAGPPGFLAAHWLEKTGSRPYDYQIRVVTSQDGGVTWLPPIVPHRDGVHAEHGFVSMRPWGGQLALVWLDGRHTQGSHGGHMGAMGLGFTTLSWDGSLGPESFLDAKVCDCCQTAAVAIPEGLLVAYRDRSDQEVRDISAVRFVNGKWSEPVETSKDGWEIAACPVNGPALSARDNRVALAWHTEAQDRPRVQVAFSDDGGATFGQPIRVDPGQPLGRVDILLLADGSALAVWLEELPERKAALLIRRVSPDGALGRPIKAAGLEAARRAGFPQIAPLADDGALLAWTDSGEEGSRVKTAAFRF